jgi:RimJ/RimL family protein N-acetyltransferase
MESYIKIETPRLTLRDFVMDDWVSSHVYACDPEVVRFMVWGPNSKQDTQNFVRQLLEWQQEPQRKVFDFAVIAKSDGQLIGSCGFHITHTVSEGSSQSVGLATAGDYNVDPYSHTRDQNAAVGYCFGKAAWGKGYATEAATAVIKFGFEQLSLHKIFATCDVENKGSARVLEKSGMKREGHLIEDIKVKGRWRDSYLYSILKQDWKPEE